LIEHEDKSINMDALKQGDQVELVRMVDLYSDSIYRVALRMLNNPADAEDVLQETFIKAFRALPGFEERSSLSTWLYRIAVNESLMLLRKQKPEVAVAEDDFIDNNESDSFPAFQILDWCCLPEDDFMTAETHEILDRSIKLLPENLRLVFILRDIEGLSIHDTAETLNISESNVKTRLLRARLKLREELSIYFSEFIKEKSRNGQ
jgi:RNA polymerase sigma-70 factor (ECF subfamily)